MTRYNQKKQLTERLASRANIELSIANFDGKAHIDKTNSPRLSAHTNMHTKEIREAYADSYAEENPTRIYAFISDAAKHEINHHRYNGIISGYRFNG